MPWTLIRAETFFGCCGLGVYGIAATLTVSILLAALAMWVRRPFYVFVSGLLVNLAGFSEWVAGIANEFRYDAHNR